MVDRSPEVLRLVSTILDRSDAAITKALAVEPASFDKSTVASELLVILHTAGELLDFFAPPPKPIEFHGAPRSMVQSEDEPELILRSEEGFDFRPWYAEKSATLKLEAALLVRDWRRDLGDVRMHPSRPSTPEATFVEDLVRNLENLRAYAQVIFDLTSERRVMVQEVKFGPEDSN